jgi:hypothetical protein
MKKILSPLLALLLAAALPLVSLASDVNNLSWKLSEQLRNGSGLKLEIVFDEISALPQLFDEATAPVLKALFSGSTVTVNKLNVAFGQQKGREETVVNVKRNDILVANLRYLSDGAVEAVQTSLLGTTYYGAAKGENALTALALSGSGGQLTGLERALVSVYTADNQWRAKVSPLMTPYTQDLSAWMQGFTAVSTETLADGTLRTVTNLSLPASEVKDKIKTLLDRFYQDEQLLSVLKERFSLREASLYLNPELKGSVIAAIDSLGLAEDVRITRVFGKAGLESDSIYLPMAGTNGLDSLLYETKMDGENQIQTVITLKHSPDETGQSKQTVISYAASSDKTGPVQGSVLIDENGVQKTYLFELTREEPEQTFDKASDLTTQAFTYTLILTPPQGNVQTIVLAGSLSSGSNTRSATKLNATFDWTDEGGAKVHATLSGGSAAPWSVEALPENIVRLDSLEKAALDGEIEKILAQLQVSIAALIGVQALPKITP